MICKVKNTLLKNNIDLSGKKVIVAVSGGADSVSLLHCMLILSHELNFTVEACHVNHSIRPEAVDDENFVKELCGLNNVLLHSYKVDVPKLSAINKIGLEECGRNERYRIFSSFKNSFVATAHTLNDKTESLLLNITRGCSVEGLCSIPVQRGNIIRPLIECTRSDVENYCHENNISYVTDSSNFDDTYSRNRIRLNVIPELKKINPALDISFNRLSDFAALDQDYFENEVSSVLNLAENGSYYDVSKIINLHPALRLRVLKQIISFNSSERFEKKHYLLLDSILNGGKVQLKKDLYVIVSGNKLWFESLQSENNLWSYGFDNLLIDNDDCRLQATIVSDIDLFPKQFIHKNVLDYDKLSGNIIVRNRREGDTVHLCGSNCTKKVKKLFTENHVIDRYKVPIISDKDGIVWIKGFGCSDRVKVSDDTKRLLMIGDINND